MFSFSVVFLCLLIFIFYLGHENNGADWGHWGTNILDGLIRIFCRKYHGQGEQKIDIPDGIPIILAPNHISGIDPFLLICATDRPIRFMIAKEEYEKPILNWMFKAAGCIPVDRSGRVETAFRSALRAINEGEIVSLFPQGGIHSSETPRLKIKPGIIKLSQLSQASILPVRITGVGAPGDIFRSVIMPSRVILKTHPLISPEQAQTVAFSIAISEWLIGDRDIID